jgi:hypothetical protein
VTPAGHLYILVNANQKFVKAFYAETHEAAMQACEGFQRVLFCGWTIKRQPGAWFQIGSNTFDLRCPSGVTRYQLFRYELGA